MKRLRLASASPSQRDASADALRALAHALAPYLRELGASECRQNELVDVLEVVPAPKRAVLRACREGRIEGAAIIGRRWLARRGAIDAWVRQHGPRRVARVEDEMDDELEQLRRSLARHS